MPRLVAIATRRPSSPAAVAEQIEAVGSAGTEIPVDRILLALDIFSASE
jgi:hypothetical protein